MPNPTESCPLILSIIFRPFDQFTVGIFKGYYLYAPRDTSQLLGRSSLLLNWTLGLVYKDSSSKMPTTASFLGLEGLHVLVTGVVDDVGYHVVKEFLGGCALI